MITWQAPEYEHRPKTPAWYWVSVIVAILLLAAAVWQRNYFFAVFIVLAELMVLMWASFEPPMVTFALNEKGLIIGGGGQNPKLHSFAEMLHWSVDGDGFFDHAWPDIFIHTKGHFHTGLRIKVPRPLLPEVETELRAKVPEVPFEPTAIDVLEKFLGF